MSRPKGAWRTRHSIIPMIRSQRFTSHTASVENVLGSRPNQSTGYTDGDKLRIDSGRQVTGWRTIGYTHIANHLKLFNIPVHKLNSVALVSKRTLPTERPPLVDEVSANFCGQRVPRDQCNGSRSRYFSIQVAPQLYSWDWEDPVPDILFLRKSGISGNQTRDLWICSQELSTLDHRGGQHSSAWKW
jgi:hypothetical protein